MLRGPGLPHLSKNDPPEPKAVIGITYHSFSLKLGKLLCPEDGNSKSIDYRGILDTLHNSTRLREWHAISCPLGEAFCINNRANLKCKFRVVVSSSAVYIVSVGTGGYEPAEDQDFDGRDKEWLRIYNGNHKVVEGLDAEALFNGIKHVQKLFESDMDNVSLGLLDDELFEPISNLEKSSALDPVLEDTGHSAQINIAAAQEKAQIQEDMTVMLESVILGHIKSLQGRVLTVIDASAADKQQREAIKTLMKKEFRREMDKMGGLAAFSAFKISISAETLRNIKEHAGKFVLQLRDDE